MMDRSPTKKLSPLNKVDAGLIVENHDYDPVSYTHLRAHET